MVLPGLRGGAITILSVLALLVAALAAAPARAERGGLFTVPDISVDVTAESAAAAREAALAEGQREALERLLLRLALAEDVARLPRLSDEEIAQTIHDFQVESERTSAVRYIGDLTFRFRADAVRQLLEEHGVRFAAITSKPVLVLPVLRAGGEARLWEDPNPWRAAWGARPSEDGLVPLVVPLGDLADLAAIDGAEALAGGGDKGFDALAERYGTGDTVVAEARVTEAGEGQIRLDIRANRYADGVVQETYSDRLTGRAAEREALFANGVQRLDELVQEAWKRDNLISFDAEQTLIATVPIGELSDWVTVRNRLADIIVIRDTEILYLMRGEGRLRLAFAGDMTQLTRALAQQDLSLTPAAEDGSSGDPASRGSGFGVFIPGGDDPGDFAPGDFAPEGPAARGTAPGDSGPGEFWTLRLGPPPTDTTEPQRTAPAAPSAIAN